MRDLKYADIDKDMVPEVFFQRSDWPLFSIVLMLRDRRRSARCRTGD